MMGTFRHAPIERHEALAPFSRDHYVGLVQARHLIRAAAGDDIERRKVVAEFVDAWDHEIIKHFEDEERLLAGLLDDADLQQLCSEHQRLSDLAARVRAERKSVDPDASLLEETGKALASHIRWEERELFNRIQERADSTELRELGRLTAAVESSRPRRDEARPVEPDDSARTSQD